MTDKCARCGKEPVIGYIGKQPVCAICFGKAVIR